MSFAFLIFDTAGGGEWLVLLAVILIVVGPKNLPAMARKIGNVMSTLRRAADEFKRQLMSMDQEIQSTVNSVKNDIIDLPADGTDTSGAVQSGSSVDDDANPYPGQEFYDDTQYQDYDPSAMDEAGSERSGTPAAPAPAEPAAPPPDLTAVKITVSRAPEAAS